VEGKKMTNNQMIALEMKILKAIEGNGWAEVAMTLPKLQFYTKGIEIQGYDKAQGSMVTLGWFRRDVEFGSGTSVMVYHTKSTIKVAHSDFEPSGVKFRIANTLLVAN